MGSSRRDKSDKKPDAAGAVDQLGQLIALRRIDELKPYPRNARTHSPEQIDELCALIKEFGFTQPILADEFIRAGHGRVLALTKLYEAGVAVLLPNGKELPKGTAPVIDCSKWSEAQKRAYVLADNRVALNAGWDDELLKLELTELRALEVEPFSLGFSDKEIDRLFGGGAGGSSGSTAPKLQSLVYSVMIAAKDEAQQRELLERFEGEGLECKAVIT